MARAGTDCEEELGWACGPNVVCGGGSVCKGRTVREEVGVAKHSLPALVGRRALDQVVFHLAREGTMWLHYRPKKIVVKLKMSINA